MAVPQDGGIRKILFRFVYLEKTEPESSPTPSRFELRVQTTAELRANALPLYQLLATVNLLLRRHFIRTTVNLSK